LEPLSKGRFLSQSQFIAPLPKGWSKSYLASDYFSSLGITLQRAIPSIALAGSTLNLEGTSTSDETLCLLVDPQGNKIVQSFTDGKQFSCSFHLAKAGEYLFVIGSGLKIEKTSTIAKIIVLPE
jgi:hypothetical protein